MVPTDLSGEAIVIANDMADDAGCSVKENSSMRKLAHTMLPTDAMRPLRDDELDMASGGIQRGCIPPFGSGDPRFPGWIRLPNPWIEPGSIQRQLSFVA